MSTALVIALCALLGVIALVFYIGALRLRVNSLEIANEILREQNKAHEKSASVLT